MANDLQGANGWRNHRSSEPQRNSRDVHDWDWARMIFGDRLISLHDPGRNSRDAHGRIVVPDMSGNGHDLVEGSRDDG